MECVSVSRAPAAPSHTAGGLPVTRALPRSVLQVALNKVFMLRGSLMRATLNARLSQCKKSFKRALYGIFVLFMGRWRRRIVPCDPNTPELSVMECIAQERAERPAESSGRLYADCRGPKADPVALRASDYKQSKSYWRNVLPVNRSRVKEFTQGERPARKPPQIIPAGRIWISQT